MTTHHHAHAHAYSRHGVHEHRRGHRGTPVSRRREPVPWPHWFAEHAHVHPDPTDEERLKTPLAPGRGAVR